MAKATRKTVGAALVSVAAVGLLVGCSGNKEETAASASPAASAGASASPSAKPAAPLVIDWLGYDSYGQPDPNSAVVKLVENKFNAKFNFWYIDAQKWDDNLNVKLAAGEMPDVLKIANRQNLPKYVSQGIVAPIDDKKIRELAPTYARFLDTSYPEVWDGVKYDGKIYAIPTTNLNGSYPTVVIWRQDWLKNVGIAKTPETIQEYEQALSKFRNEDPDKDGKKDTYGLSDYSLPNILGAFGYPGISDFKGASKGDASKSVQFTLKDNKVVLASIQPEMKEALALLQKWYKDGLIDPEFLTSENTTGYWADSQAFYNNKIGLTGMGMFYHWRNVPNPDVPGDAGGGQYKAFKQAQPNGEIAFGKPAVGPKGKSGTPMWDTASQPVAVTTKAASDPRKLETLLKMMEAASTDYDYFLTVTAGEKGVDWKMDGDKFVNLTAADSAADASKKGKVVLSGKASYDPFLKKRDAFDYKFADQYAKTAGYKSLYVPTVDAYGKYSATLNKLTVDAYFKIITGEASVDTFDEYVKKFRASGGDELEKAVSDAYNKMVGK